MHFPNSANTLDLNVKRSSEIPLTQRSALREAISALTRQPEPLLLPDLMESARLSGPQAVAVQVLALRLARTVREAYKKGYGSGRAGLVQGLLQEFALSSQEGVVLMCLAEALLRIPDTATRDALIRDKIGDANWQQHLGHSASLFVNAAAWGLLLTGKLLATHSDTGLMATLRRIVVRGGEPLVRKAVDQAMRMMGEQFVAGETIAQALSNARTREAQGFRYSYDMLGEAALTADDAQRYLAAYEEAIHAIGQAAAGRGMVEGPGISIKLSALHPRYARSQAARVMTGLYPRLLHLARLARRYNIGLNIDAEESERLELSLDLLERLCFEPDLDGWHGIGFVIQAYQKRCPAVVDDMIDLARRSGHRLMVRLVKGAYWDSEIKRAQVDGQTDYPVYTRKAYTDVAYIACARKLLAASDAIFPQFATHNAQTLATLYTLAGPGWYPGQYEFQCLYGMGEPLYEQVVGAESASGLGRPCRIYAPVGTHETLLAYLVRRLLENGANSSFVNQIADEKIPLDALVEDPVQTIEAMARIEGHVGVPHPSIALPRALYLQASPARVNSSGLDLAAEATLAALDQAFADASSMTWRVEPMLAAYEHEREHERATEPWQSVRNPADRNDVVGEVRESTLADVEAALAAADRAAASWSAILPAQRAACLDAAADRIEADVFVMVPLLVREAGKTRSNAVAEVREAVDFLRYYAAQVRRDFDNATHVPLGPVVCISPWNFPLAIFIGQVAAALAAGNVVLAKPAEQTPLVAAVAVRALHAAGVPRAALQLLPGHGEVGAALTRDARVHGVLFTGSTEVARWIQGALAQRLTRYGQLVPLIAETGGQNAMVVDSSAHLEQAVTDIITSAFDSAGQRCSALRLLCVQEDVADRLIGMLQGAIHELQVGDPRILATDVGPVIDAEAKATIERHVQKLHDQACPVWRHQRVNTDLANGHFVAPTVIELSDMAELGREVFGPVLHVVRYQRDQLATLLSQINATGYGLTLGVHTRIDETVAQVVVAARVGNIYVNRNVVGAVVGVQPFGGEGLSGTGPKAGGPLYLLRLLSKRPLQAARLAVLRSRREVSESVRSLLDIEHHTPAHESIEGLRRWARQNGLDGLAAQCDQAEAESPIMNWAELPGPTGEANLYAVFPRQAVLGLVDDALGSEADRLAQLAAVLALGARAVWPASAQQLRERLPPVVREQVSLVPDWTQPSVAFDVVLHHGSPARWLAVAAILAQRPGPVIGLIGMQPGEHQIPLEALVVERSLSINTAAAGGNASLMTID